MKVLFVSSGNESGQPKNVVFNQGYSLEKKGIEIRYFCIKGHGLKGYMSSVPDLKKEIWSFSPDIVHAHYSLSGLIASLAGAAPIVVSLMGSEAYHKKILFSLTRYFSNHRWNRTIVKSAGMHEMLKLNKAEVVPNGVDLDVFYARKKNESCARTGMDPKKINVLFVADPSRAEKNFAVASEAVASLNNDRISLSPVYNIPNTDLPWYYSAANVLLMTSLWEGSPNVIKEAMACNCPIVSTNVGDIGWVTGSLPGTYLTSHSISDVTEKLKKAIQFSESEGRTKGCLRIKDLKLDSASVAEKLTCIYNEVLKG